MKKFHRNQGEVSLKTGKKGRKLKKNHSAEVCKCFTPFVKLHWWDCPEVNKPCPIHGNILYQNVKPERVEPDQNVTVSFHPSSSTEKLFEPVKSLLAQCDPETKINFQYFSPKSFTGKKNHQTIQTSFEDLKKNANSNMFVEKTKSSVNDKTNKIKKLKECFHSPCNSITQKYPSPTSVRRNVNEISNEESIPPWQNFFSGDTNYGQNSEWLSSNPFSFKKLERLSTDKRDSDFITVTQHNKDNVISHKIFEIDHRKGMNENQMVGFPKQPTQFAYSSFNVNYPNDSRKRYNFSQSEENKSKKQNVIEYDLNSRNSEVSTSSGGSVYVTPFMLVPPGLELSDTESYEEPVVDGKRNAATQTAEDLCEEKPKLLTRYVQISHICESSDSASEQRMNTISLQTEPPSRIKPLSKYIASRGSSMETVSEKFSYNEKIVQTNIHDNTIIDTEKKAEKKGSKLKTTEVQTSKSYQVKEVLITRYHKPTKEATSQARNPALEIQECDSCNLNKSITTHPSFSNKKTQASRSQSQTQFTEEEDRKVKCDPNRLEKYYSDSDFLDRKNQAGTCSCSEKSDLPSKKGEEDKSTPLSDLSELKRMISEFFERAACKCREKQNQKEKNQINNSQTLTKSQPSKPSGKETLVNAEMQTTESSFKNQGVKATTPRSGGEAEQNRKNVALGVADTVKSNNVCSVCGQNVNKTATNAATTTEDLNSIKGKTTIIETDRTEITRIKKGKDPTEPTEKSTTTSTKQSVRPQTNSNQTPKAIKSIQVQTPSTKSFIPVPVSATPTQSRSEKQKQPLANKDSRELPSQSSPYNFRGKTSPQSDIQRGVSPQSRECQCKRSEAYFAVQDDRNAPKTDANQTQRSNRTDAGSSHRRYREDPKERKENPKKQNRQFYHVFVDPLWPRYISNSWKSKETFSDYLKLNMNHMNRKSGCEKDGQLYDTLSTKNNFDETEELQKEISDSEKRYLNVEKLVQVEPSKKENSGFVRMPSSSASQISINKNLHYQSKVIKSEESVKTFTQPLGCTSMRIFGEDAPDLFTVKSCHLNPLTFAYDGQSCDKVLACSVCKSVMLVKVNKNDDFTYVPGLSDMFQNRNEPDKIPTDEVHERQSYEKLSYSPRNVDEHEEDEYVDNGSNYSDTTTRTIENDYFKEENSDSEC